MNVVERVIRKLDRAQQRRRRLGFVVGVIKKFGDDRCSALAVMLTYYAFVSIFPLLLVLTTILGFVGNESLSRNVIGTTLQQFPVFGQQIGKDAAHPLSGNGFGLIVGLLGTFYGSLGFAQAAQHAMAEVWNVPGVRRSGFFPRLARSVILFTVLGIGLAAATVVSSLVTLAGQPGVTRVLAFLGAVVLNVGLYLAAFRILTPKVIEVKRLVPGAVVGGVGYSILLTVGAALIQHQLRHSEALYGQFAFVLGLIGWLLLVSQLSLYAAETNVVLARRLWPRSIVQPPLTDADERVLSDIAQEQWRRPEQRVDVGFDRSESKMPQL
ncbi:MAG: YihY/virulence factor BrkB family protein [Acidimicrobiales bacterium]